MTEQIHNTADEPNAAIRLTMMPRDTNAHGTVFGGVILSYIDVAGGVEAVRHTRHDRFVTVAMKEVIFHEPVFMGDLVSFYAETLRVGSTSISGTGSQSGTKRLVRRRKDEDAYRIWQLLHYGFGTLDIDLENHVSTGFHDPLDL